MATGEKELCLSWLFKMHALYKEVMLALFYNVNLFLLFKKKKQSAERASFRSLNLHAESVKGFNMGRAISTGSLASSTLNRLAVRPLSVQAEILKRLSCSELSLFQPLPGSSKDKNEKTSWEDRPRVMSKSFHDLSQSHISVYPPKKNIIAALDSSSQKIEDIMGRVFQQIPKFDTGSAAGALKLSK